MIAKSHRLFFGSSRKSGGRVTCFQRILKRKSGWKGAARIRFSALYPLEGYPHRSMMIPLFFLVSLLVLLSACRPVEPAPTVIPALTPTSTRTATSQPSLTPSTTPLPSPSPAPTSTPGPTDTPALTATSRPSPTPVTFPPAVALEPAFSGFRAPVYLAQAGDESQLFVVEKAGRIILIKDGVVQPTPFLDITDRVGSAGSEQGLLSVAFPSDFTLSGAFYVNYTDQRGDTVVARYRLLEGDPRQADPTSEQVVLRVEQPAANHNGGQLQFGPDGYLYVGMGDGGRAGDPWGNAQNPGVLLGKMLRLDVAGTETYKVPPDNPFVGRADVCPEIWALGLRNPWRFSFDRTMGDLYIADVGQNRWEEVDFQPAGSPGGENYGWDVMEGNHCFEPATGCDPSGLVPPVAEYDHSQGCSITGGYVYRGTRYPQMAGVYFFGDYCSGRVWGLRREPDGEWTMTSLLETKVSISSFGEDAAGELYVVSYNDGVIYHLVGLP